MANLITNDTDLAVWMNPTTFLRFWKETDSNVFESADGMKFRTFDEADNYAARG